MQSRARRIDVLIIFRAGFLESMKSAVGVVLCETRVRLSLLRQLDRLVFAEHYFDLLSEYSQLVHVSQRCRIERNKSKLIVAARASRYIKLHASNFFPDVELIFFSLFEICLTSDEAK